MGHPSYNSMSFLKNIVENFEMPTIKCVTCIKAKQTKTPFYSSKRVTKDVLELIHTDVCGPLPQKSLSGHNYFITIIDDFSKKVFIYPLINKSEVFQKLVDFKNTC